METAAIVALSVALLACLSYLFTRPPVKVETVEKVVTVTTLVDAEGNHVHRWSRWYDTNMKRTFSDGQVHSYTGQRRDCYDCGRKELA